MLNVATEVEMLCLTFHHFIFTRTFSFLSFLNLSCFNGTDYFVKDFICLAKFLFHLNNAVQRLPEYGHQDKLIIQAIKTIKQRLNRCKGVNILFFKNHHSSQVLVYFKIYLFLSIYTSI